MPRRRPTQAESSKQYHSSSQEQNQNQPQTCQATLLLSRLISSFDQIFKIKQWMVPLGEANTRLGNTNLIGQTYIINGPAQSGKSSLVYWALRNDDEHIAVVTVDCSLYRTQMQFIQKLTKQIGEKIGAINLDRKIIASQNIKFSDLNPTIMEHNRPIIILIRNAQRLVQVRKQILLYNLLEWMLTDIKKMVGLVFTTRLMFFIDKFQKRVRSRLAAKQITVIRPNPDNLRLLLLRRVQCLLQEETMKERQGERVDNIAIKLFQKIVRCMSDNKELTEIIRDNQEYAQKDIVFYLNSMKIVFSTFRNIDEILNLQDKQLKRTLSIRMKDSFDFIFPFIPKNLFKTCTYPQYVIMAIICHMSRHDRTPFRFKTVYQIYLQFRQKLVTQEGTGSSFGYSKNVLERAVLKLQELHLIQLESRDQSLWNCEIRCTLYPEDLRRTMDQVNQKDGLPMFIQEILNC